MEGPIIAVDGGIDDVTIVQGLLNNPKNAGKRTSDPIAAACLPTHDVLFAPESNMDTLKCLPADARRRHMGTSNTWTSSDAEVPSETDDIVDRSAFVAEYNRLAKKHGVRNMIVDDFENPIDGSDMYDRPGSWFSRRILRRTSSTQSIKAKIEQRPGPGGLLKHKRSISDLSLRLKTKNDRLKDKDLQELVVLCGSSLLYLPAEYAVGSLAVPTCFRATAQYLVQYAPTTRGVFRVPGSHGTVALLYNHYCAIDAGGDVISGTVRCPTLPEHIPCDVHDVASAFKKFLSGLPGGILGSLRLFDALISIQTQLHGDPEWIRTKQSKCRRNLICAVFGLLCIIGRTAETSKREDARGRPLPTTDLMGYGPLGIIFGPLLIGDLLESYSMRLADPRGGLIILPISPVKSRKEKEKEKEKSKKPKSFEESLSFNTYVDKIKVANGVTEMLITHWREVVRHMRNLKESKPLTSHKSLLNIGSPRLSLRPSASDTFTIRKPPEWENLRRNAVKGSRNPSPTPVGRASELTMSQGDENLMQEVQDNLKARKQRSRKRPPSLQMLTGSLSILSPTTEERSKEDFVDLPQSNATQQSTSETSLTPKRKGNDKGSMSSQHSKKSRKQESCGTPSSGKLRKPRPSEDSNETQLSPMKSRSKRLKGLPSTKSKSRSQDSLLDSLESNRTLKIDAGGGKQKVFPSYIQPAFSSASKLFQPLSTLIPRKDTQIPEGAVIRQIRRIADSEPVQKSQQTLTVEFSSRVISKSLNLPRLTDRNFHNNLCSKDPLNSVSKEEDILSLHSLARVIRSEDSRFISKNIDSLTRSPPRTASSAAASPAGILRGGHFNSRRWEEENPQEDKQLTDLTSTANMELAGESLISFSMVQHPRSGPLTSSHELTVKDERPLSEIQKRMTNTPSPVKRFNSPAQSVKALAARFDSGQFTTVFESPRKVLPTRLGLKDSSPSIAQPDGLLAHYTVNTPSPTRSQMSLQSERTLISNRNPFQVRSDSETVVNPSKIAARINHYDVDNSNEEGGNIASSIESSSPVNLFHQKLSNPITPITDSCARRTPIPPYITQENAARTFDGHRSHESIQNIPVHQASDSLISSRITSGGISHNHNEAEHLTALTGMDKSGDLSSSTDPKVIRSPHVRFAKVTFDSTAEAGHEADPHFSQSTSTLDGSDAIKRPLSRSNSVLHTQIRDLQRQLGFKEDEFRQLRLQLDARSHLDIGTLSDQLRKAKVQINFWKDKADIAEKQVEMLSARKLGRSLSNKISLVAPLSQIDQENSNNFRLSGKMTRGQYGMDGAGVSNTFWSSEETTGTVVKNQNERDIFGDSGCTDWVEQALRQLEEPLELD